MSDSYESRLRNNSNMLYSPVTDQMWEQIDRTLTPMAKKWAGEDSLKMNNVYGIRYVV
jgi:hypothetical protein